MNPTISRRSVLFGAAGLSVAATIGFSASSLPRAAANDLRIFSASEWGAKPVTWQPKKLMKRPTRVVVHHMATPNVTDYSKEAAFKIARDVQSWHQGQDWGDSGQQFSISRGGHILEGRQGSLAAAQDGSYFIEGIHAPTANQDSIGIENEGTYSEEIPPEQQWNALVDLIVYLCGQYGMKATGIVGHRNCSSTQCPGDKFFGELDRLRSEVDVRLGGDGNVPPLEDAPSTPTGEWPVVKTGGGNAEHTVRAVQHLLRQHGQSIEVDGAFGPASTAALKAVQQAKGLAVDGVCGAKSWQALIVTRRQGDTGEAVKAVQVLVNAKQKAGLEVDGSFGAATQQQVRAFQEAKKLDVDGVVGAKTWRSLAG